MNIGHIFETFSRRKPKPSASLDSLTTEFRNRVLMLCYDNLSPLAGYTRVEFWSAMHSKLRFLHGHPILSGTERGTDKEDVVLFLQTCSDEHFLDFVEKIFQLGISQAGWTHDDRTVNAINEFFNVDDLPYRLTKHVYSPVELIPGKELGLPTHDSNRGIRGRRLESYPQVICSENEAVHKMAIEPTLTFLTHPAFVQANKEFLESLKDYRRGDYRDCVAKCGSALESVMKVICDRKGWAYQQQDTAAKLLKTILGQTALDPFYEQPILLIATIRNRYSSAHGAGTQKKTVPKHVANYVINATASAILLLTDETNP